MYGLQSTIHVIHCMPSQHQVNTADSSQSAMAELDCTTRDGVHVDRTFECILQAVGGRCYDPVFAAAPCWLCIWHRDVRHRSRSVPQTW